MSNLLAVPKASDDPVNHADWLELRAMEAADRNASLIDLAREIARSGTTDATPLAKGQSPKDKAGQLAEDAIEEVEDRIAAAEGDTDVYPFELDHAGQLLQYRKEGDESLYAFLLLLTHINVDKEKEQAGIDGTQLFEEVCAAAATGYLGGDHPRVGWYPFGFPRRQGPKSFAEALDAMCARMGEGVGHRQQDNLSDKNDAGLDLVVWRGFADGRSGKLIGFAQCKAGRNWEKEIRTLQVNDFCADWLREMPVVLPVRMFFVPCRVSSYGRQETCRGAGILFDRCRIVEYAARVNDQRTKQWRKWSKEVIRTMIRKKKGK